MKHIETNLEWSAAERTGEEHVKRRAHVVTHLTITRSQRVAKSTKSGRTKGIHTERRYQPASLRTERLVRWQTRVLKSAEVWISKFQNFKIKSARTRPIGCHSQSDSYSESSGGCSTGKRGNISLLASAEIQLSEHLKPYLK